MSLMQVNEWTKIINNKLNKGIKTMKKEITVLNLCDKDGYGSEDVVTEITARELKKSGETFLKLTPDGKAVYVLDCYDRSRKGYYITNYETSNERFIKSDRKIYIGFTY